MAESLLTVRDVAIERGYRRLLSGVNFSVQAGQLWQLAGANGVGKTSFLRALAGLASFGVSGDINLHDTALYQGHLPGLKSLLTPLENLRYHPSGVVFPDPHRIREALSIVGLGGYEEEPVHSLSAGQQRRVGLARLWLTETRLWLLDEPFTALDTAGATLLRRRLLEHVDGGGAVVFTSHQPNPFADRLNTLDLAHHAA